MCPQKLWPCTEQCVAGSHAARMQEVRKHVTTMVAVPETTLANYKWAVMFVLFANNSVRIDTANADTV